MQYIQYTIITIIFALIILTDLLSYPKSRDAIASKNDYLAETRSICILPLTSPISKMNIFWNTLYITLTPLLLEQLNLASLFVGFWKSKWCKYSQLDQKNRFLDSIWLK